jgi:hypothetical protein
VRKEASSIEDDNTPNLKPSDSRKSIEPANPKAKKTARTTSITRKKTETAPDEQRDIAAVLAGEASPKKRGRPVGSKTRSTARRRATRGTRREDI